MERIKQNQARECIILSVSPEVDFGKHPIKRVPGEIVEVEAEIISDGTDIIIAKLLFEDSGWQSQNMVSAGNDFWKANFKVNKPGAFNYTVEAWIDHFQTWQTNLHKKILAGQDTKIELEIGRKMIEKVKHLSTEFDKFLANLNETALDSHLAQLMEKHSTKKVFKYDKILEVVVERPKARFSSWYEIFPRSCGPNQNHGTFKDLEKILPDIADMGFDTIYLPPIHPIGKTHKKGKNGSLICNESDPGSPWAIGSKAGGHKSIHQDLGTLKEFRSLISKSKELGMEIALDIAFQCSPDHPYVASHPEWFKWRPDHSIQYAENPPKKYEDIVPIYFETRNWKKLWTELNTIIEFWMDNGITIFRIDNPHTKPFNMWEFLIANARKKNPEVLFLAEAFTRPHVVYYLSKIGFSQSYTYFTWRSTKSELIEYMKELTATDVKEYFRPNFWANTPDILMKFLHNAPRSAFMIRLILAATLSSNFGIYGPAFELCINVPKEHKEEYQDSEKYEIKLWDRDKPGNIKQLIKKVNMIRCENAALQQTNNIIFCETDNDKLICYMKKTDSNTIIIIVNLDPYNKQSGWVNIELAEHFKVLDLLNNSVYDWKNGKNYVELSPELPAHILRYENVV